MSFLVRASGNLRFIPVFSHHIWEKFDATRLRQIVHPVHLSERKDVAVILQRNHAPVLNLIILTSDTADMKSPDAIIGMLVITELAERDTQFRRPTGISHVDIGLPFPYGIPA